MDKAAVKALLTSRKSTFPKQFTGQKIPSDVIVEILELAHLAPSHKNTMPWRFLVFTEDSMRALLDFKKDFYIKNTPAEKILEKKLIAFEERKKQVSHIIGIVVHKDERVNLPAWEEMAAVSCAVQNIYLSLNAYEIGGYWSTGKLTLSEEIKDYLSLEKNEDFIGFMYLGIPESKPLQGKKEAIGDRIKWMK